jgi:hypothetical protein
VHYAPGSTELSRVGRANLFETSIVVHQPRLFDLAEALGEEGWGYPPTADEHGAGGYEVELAPVVYGPLTG